VPSDGFINLSPKGMDAFRIVDDKTVVWLNLTGSGNETAAHLLEDDRMTIMMCAFEENPLILRMYGSAFAIHPRDDEWAQYIALFPNYLGARQLIKLNVELIMSSCGFGVPIMPFERNRTEMEKWAIKKGDDGIAAYWTEKNQVSLNGRPTGLLKNEYGL
jgi:hypothetical protein